MRNWDRMTHSRNIVMMKLHLNDPFSLDMPSKANSQHLPLRKESLTVCKRDDRLRTATEAFFTVYTVGVGIFSLELHENAKKYSRKCENINPIGTAIREMAHSTVIIDQRAR